MDKSLTIFEFIVLSADNLAKVHVFQTQDPDSYPNRSQMKHVHVLE